eukprot:COSAG06_NODE_23931_length_677_cov_1.304498_1_plen_39_part_01
MVLSLLLVSVPASKLPRDGESGRKICVAPNSTYNCAACC